MTCCPSCGFNLTRDEIVEVDGWSFDPRGLVSFEGRDVDLPRAQVVMLHTLASAGGRPVTRDVLLNRIGSDGLSGVCPVQFARTRRLLRDLRLPIPFHTVRQRGYAWGVAA